MFIIALKVQLDEVFVGLSNDLGLYELPLVMFTMKSFNLISDGSVEGLKGNGIV